MTTVSLFRVSSTLWMYDSWHCFRTRILVASLALPKAVILKKEKERACIGCFSCRSVSDPSFGELAFHIPQKRTTARAPSAYIGLARLGIFSTTLPHLVGLEFARAAEARRKAASAFWRLSKETSCRSHRISDNKRELSTLCAPCSLDEWCCLVRSWLRRRRTAQKRILLPERVASVWVLCRQHRRGP